MDYLCGYDYKWPYTDVEKYNDDWLLCEMHRLRMEVDSWASLLKVSSCGVFTPEMFGAKGDNNTDDTLAIQKMFDNVRAGTIVFDHNSSYIVSKEITIYSGYSTLTVLLGSIKYVTIPNVQRNAVIRLQSDTSTGDSTGRGSVKLIGGCIDAGGTAYTGIQNYNSFHVAMFGVKIRNYVGIGLDVGNDDGISISAQMMVSSCYIDNFGLSEEGTAIRVTHTDNNFSNVVTNAHHVAVEVYYGGNFFSNCHFTSSSKKQETDENRHIFVKTNSPDTGAVQVNVFNGCYFNGTYCKYFTYNERSCSLELIFSSSEIILGRSYVDNTLYIQNDKTCALSMNNVGVRKSDNQTFVGISVFTASAKQFRNTSDIRTDGNISHNLLDITALSTQTHPLLTLNSDMPPGSYILAGYAVFYSTIPSVVTFHYTFNGRIAFNINMTIHTTTLENLVGSIEGSESVEFYADKSSEIISVGEFRARIKRIYMKNVRSNSLSTTLLCKTSSFKPTSIAFQAGTMNIVDVDEDSIELIVPYNSSNNVITCYGDSIAAGYNGFGFQDNIYRKYGTRINNRGIGSTGYLTTVTVNTQHLAGNDTPFPGTNQNISYADNNFTAKIKAEIAGISNRFIMIFGGGNDLISHSVEEIINSMTEAVTTIKSSDKIPLIVSPTLRSGRDLSDLISAMKTKCYELHVPFLDLSDLSISQFLPDGLHPSNSGYSIIASRIFAFINEHCYIV